MLLGRFLLILCTLLCDALAIDNSNELSKLMVAPIQSISLASDPLECQQACSIDYCLKHVFLNENCTKLTRDQCDCCTVCLRKENEICGGRFQVYGVCEEDFLCYKSNQIMEQTGICVKACSKFQCLLVTQKNRTICDCANRRVPCDRTLQFTMGDTCEDQADFLKIADVNTPIDCSDVVCKPSAKCPVDSHFVVNHTTSLLDQSAKMSSICCEPRGHCVCSVCPKTLCGENSIIQVYRTGNRNLPGQCCDQFNCITNSKQCHHDKKIYNENETWSIDHCTTCTCRGGHVDCTIAHCPIYTHCGYMYKPENECCPKCGGCLNDRFHLQHMNSTWMESNGCMRCWCENGRSRCMAEGCIAPPCENPRQIANVCCPVCDDHENKDEHSSELTVINQCTPFDNCLLVCEHGLAKDDNGCLQCACSTMSCPSPLCTLKFDQFSKQYCLCSPPTGSSCEPLQCDKHCPYDYSIDQRTRCPSCHCNPCPQLICTKNCTYGLKKNEVGCPICVCQSNLTAQTELTLQSWPRQCQSGAFSYSSGEIWFDGCRQCLCHRGEQLCALISCPIPKCSQPIMLPNRCCPSCPGLPILPEPIPSSQVCYASQYVTGEELEFDKCTKCICLHNIAFCSVSICPPLPCSSPIYEPSLCCPICPSSSSITDLTNTNEDVCLLDNGMIKHAGEVWKQNDCQSCLCSRDSGGQSECFSQVCSQQLPCPNPILQKGQCCPFCLPPTAAVAVCIFNYVQYRSGEHWNVSECQHCECSRGTIVCHQRPCPRLTCVYTVTLPGHCCPICRDQLPFLRDEHKLAVSPSRFGFSILVLFSVLILLLLLVIFILIFFLLRGKHRSRPSSNQISNRIPRSPILSHHQSNLSSYRYKLMVLPNDMDSTKVHLSSINHLPLTSIERTSTHSMIETNTTGTTSSSNNELEPSTWNEEDDTLILQCSTSSNDGDYEHEILNTDNDESHFQLSSHSQFQAIATTPTIIYV